MKRLIAAHRGFELWPRPLLSAEQEVFLKKNVIIGFTINHTQKKMIIVFTNNRVNIGKVNKV